MNDNISKNILEIAKSDKKKRFSIHQSDNDAPKKANGLWGTVYAQDEQKIFLPKVSSMLHGKCLSRSWSGMDLIFL